MSPTPLTIRTARRNPDTCIHFLQRSPKRGLYHSHCGWVVPPGHAIAKYESGEDFRRREGARIVAKYRTLETPNYAWVYCRLCLKTPYGQSIVGARP